MPNRRSWSRRGIFTLKRFYFITKIVYFYMADFPLFFFCSVIMVVESLEFLNMPDTFQVQFYLLSLSIFQWKNVLSEGEI